MSELLADVHRMAIATQDMLRRALAAFEQQDLDLARTVHSDDQRIDDLYRQLYQLLPEFLRGKSRATIKQARYLAQVARNLERTADRVTNISEWVVFSATGEVNGIGLGTAVWVREEMV